ncbi:MAG: UvrD-helicase domain-containing protein [Thiotrichaceae bacterium]
MNTAQLLDSLNEPQQHAVTAEADENVVVLAGAGSGKTRVLAHRIAWLLFTEQARSPNILAVTFTNKAAREMQTRITQLLNESAQGLSPNGMWVGTFHGLAHRLLRIHHEQARLAQNFQVLDTGDQDRLLKQILKRLELDEKVWNLKSVKSFISQKKERGIRAQSTDASAIDSKTGYQRIIENIWSQLPKEFQRLDKSKKHAAIQKIINQLNLNEWIWTPESVNASMNRYLNAQDAHTFSPEPGIWQQRMDDIYLTYETHCQQQNLVDFSELLLRSYELWRDNPALLEQYQQRFRYVLVDEFQDINDIQYAWLRMLSHDKSAFFMVGDDDQSIYSFRGAKIEYIQSANQDFPNSKLIRLEQNYRSSKMILATANALISHNQQRLGKNLWTQRLEGDPVYLYVAHNEKDEAEFIVQKIQDWTESLQEVAILYRTSAQSQQFEEILLQKSIPYRIHGGLRFYERAEVKDSLAYLRLAYNYQDDGAFERIINTPKRGIGERSLEIIRLKRVNMVYHYGRQRRNY